MFNLSEKVLGGLLAQIGMTPEQVAELGRLAHSELLQVQSDREAFRAAVPHLVAHFQERFEALSTRLKRIETMLDALLPAPAQVLNGIEKDPNHV